MVQRCMRQRRRRRWRRRLATCQVRTNFHRCISATCNKRCALCLLRCCTLFFCCAFVMFLLLVKMFAFALVTAHRRRDYACCQFLSLCWRCCCNKVRRINLQQQLLQQQVNRKIETPPSNAYIYSSMS